MDSKISGAYDEVDGKFSDIACCGKTSVDDIVYYLQSLIDKHYCEIGVFAKYAYPYFANGNSSNVQEGLQCFESIRDMPIYNTYLYNDNSIENCIRVEVYISNTSASSNDKAAFGGEDHYNKKLAEESVYSEQIVDVYYSRQPSLIDHLNPNPENEHSFYQTKMSLSRGENRNLQRIYETYNDATDSDYYSISTNSSTIQESIHGYGDEDWSSIETPPPPYYQ